MFFLCQGQISDTPNALLLTAVNRTALHKMVSTIISFCFNAERALDR